MPNEAGDMKLLGNFRKLIDHISADPTYNPSNPSLAKTALEAQHAAAMAAVQEVLAKLASNKLATGERAEAFEPVSPLVTRSRNLLKATGASEAVLADAQTFARKIAGTRKTSKARDTKSDGADTPKPETPKDEADATHSASQLSFENRLGNLNGYLAILTNVPSYNPNESDLKVNSLKAMAAGLQSKNDAVSATFAALGQARGLRDQLLYLNENSVVNTALLAKAYVSGALGVKSQLYKLIKGLQFKRRD